MKLHSTTCYVIYKQHSTKSLTTLEQLWDAIPTFLEEQQRIPRSFRLKRLKQVRIAVWRRWWNAYCSSKQLRFLETVNCSSLMQVWTVWIVKDSWSNTCKQHFQNKYRWWIHQELAQRSVNWWIDARKVLWKF